MLEIFQQIIDILTTDPTLNAIVPAANIFTGPVDMTMETQKSLLYPSLVLSLGNESVRSVPSNARDTMIQIDIWSRTSQLEVLNIYEQLLVLLNYQQADQGAAHIFWTTAHHSIDLFETDRRVWHRVCTFVVWSIKP